MTSIIKEEKFIPNHHFSLRSKHSLIDQVKRITNIIETSLEEKKVCSTIFLDVAQAFHKVWHEGLIYKLKIFLPRKCLEILHSYISERYFRNKREDFYTD